MFPEDVDLKRERPGIGGVPDEQLEHTREAGGGKVTTSIRHDAIRHLKDGLENGIGSGPHAGGGGDEAGDGKGAFESAAKIEEAPAEPACHVLHLHAIEGGEIENEVVDQGQGIGEGKPAGAGGGIEIQSAEDAPGVA